MTNLNEISKQFHERAKQKGFWDDKREIGTLLMLVVSELSEALEADRKNKHADLYKFERRQLTSLLTQPHWFINEFSAEIKDTFEDEIADTFIRLFDLVGFLGIDIDKHIELKMKFNATREHKHGKAY